MDILLRRSFCRQNRPVFPEMTEERGRGRFLTSCLCDRWVGGGLHRHGCSVADGGRGEIGETCLSAHSLPARTAPIAERVLDNSLEEVESRTCGSTR